MATGETAIEVVEETGEIVGITKANNMGDEIGLARVRAKILQDLVTQNPNWSVQIDKSKKAPSYLKVEAWQALGAAYGYSAVLDGDVVRDTVEPQAWVAKVKILNRFGTQVGGAQSICGTEDDGRWATQPTNSRMSMAETRAISKGFRSCLSFVAVLAGYEPTPAEEMEHVQPNKASSESQHSFIRNMAKKSQDHQDFVSDFLEEHYPDLEPLERMVALTTVEASKLLDELQAL